MKLSLPALLDAGRRFIAGLAMPRIRRQAFTRRQLRQARRGFFLLGLTVATFIALHPPAAQAQDWVSGHWIGTWGAGPGGPPLPATTQTYTNQTLRLIVHTSVGGNRVRIRLSNETGSTPLNIGGAHIAVRASGSAIQAGTDRAPTFSGNASITIPPGAPVLSDPVDLPVAPLSDLAISIYLPGTVSATTIHGTASQTNYVSGTGDYTGDTDFKVDHTILPWPFLTEADVTGGQSSGGAAIVTFGDSITDGTRSTPNTNNRWPDWLARRLQTVREPEGSLAGRSALERFDRDVNATAGVRYMTVLLGINDIGNSSATNKVEAGDIVAGYRQLIARATARASRSSARR